MTGLSDHLLRVMGTQAFRLAAMSAAGFLVASAVIVGVLFWQTNSVLTDHVVEELRAEAADLARSLAGADAERAAEVIRQRSASTGSGLYLLRDGNGRKLAGNLTATPDGLADEGAGNVFRYTPTSAPGTTRLAVAIPVPIGSGLSLMIGRDIESQIALADGIKRTFLWGFGALALAALIAGLWIGRSVLGRIELINATTQSIMAGDLSRRIPLSGARDELDTLSESLNAMLERIEQLMSGLKEVSDNIAHDLKTPLNRLRNGAEAALRDSRGAEAYRDGLESTIEKADELIKTFNALLLIARLEAGVVEETAEPFDLGQLVFDVAELYEPVADEAGLRLDIDARSGLGVRANRQLVGQAVANLVDNAIKYSADAARQPNAVAAEAAVSVRVTEEGRAAEISVADRGPGIAPADRARALRRFVRLEKSRTRPGTGLGLSLVAAVARLHHGSVRLEDNDPGLRVVVTLPLVNEKRPVPEALGT